MERIEKGDPCPPFTSHMSTHPSLPFLLSQKGGIVQGVQSPGRLNTARGEVWYCVGEKWGSVFGVILFLLKKEKIRSIVLLQLGQMGLRKASYPYALTHPCMSHSGPR